MLLACTTVYTVAKTNCRVNSRSIKHSMQRWLPIKTESFPLSQWAKVRHQSHEFKKKWNLFFSLHIALIDNNECVGCEAEVSNHIETLEEQWKDLLDKIAEKGQKLREANQQQQYNEAVKDIDFWLGGLEAQLASEDCGRDLAAVHNLLKKHHLLEADIAAHEVGGIS